MGGNCDEQLAGLEIFIAQAMILGTEDEGDFPRSRRRDNLGSDVAWCLAVLAVKPRSASSADDQGAVRNRFANCGVTSRFAQNVAAMNGHGPRPETLGAGATDNRQLRGAHVFHGASDGANVSRAAGPDHHNT